MKKIIVDTNSYEKPSEGNSIYETRNNVITIGSNNYPLVSILVIAYKRLDKTRNCIESILKYTEGIDYELVLVDCGSEDGTVEYFESIEYDKKTVVAITKNMMLSFGVMQGTKYCNGKYIAFLNNDMVVTYNWLNNILKCFDSDERVGLVCTCSSNASNKQDPKLEFDSLEEMQKLAMDFNKSDPRKWHERLRLLTLGTVYKKECIDISGNWDYGFSHNFADDDLSFKIRRAGYKIILCNDVFVHHDHIYDFTDKEAMKMNDKVKKAKNNFQNKYYGIDAWYDVNNYEQTLISMVEKIKNEKHKILGVDVKCGTPLLEIKNKLKEYDRFDTVLYAFVEDAKYYVDLKTICEDVICDRINYLYQTCKDNKFDYIIIGKCLNEYEDPYNILVAVKELLNDDGKVLLKIKNGNNIHKLLNIIEKKESVDTLNLSINISEFQFLVNEVGLILDNNISEQYGIDETTRKYFDKNLKDNKIGDKEKDILMTDTYNIRLSKK